MICLADVRTMLFYLPHVREYGIRVVDPYSVLDHQPIRIRPIRFCPWCGGALPESLRATWEAEVAARGLVPDDPDTPTNLPGHLIADLWWRLGGRRD